MNKNVESRVKKDSTKEIKKATANIFNNYMKNDFEHNNNLLIEDNNNNNKRRKVSVNDDDQFYITMQKTENEDDAPLQQIENDDENEIINNQEDDNTWKISMFNELNKMAIKDYVEMVDDLIWNCYDKDLPDDFSSSLNGTEIIIPIESNTKGEFAKKLANYFRMINMNILDIAPLFQILNDLFKI